MSDDAPTIDRRTVLESAGAAIGAAVGVGAGTAAAAAAPGCKVTTKWAKAATECPVVSHETYLDAGRTGFAGASCVVDGKTWVNVTFECQESFYVEASALADASDCTC